MNVADIGVKCLGSQRMLELLRLLLVRTAALVAMAFGVSAEKVTAALVALAREASAVKTEPARQLSAFQMGTLSFGVWHRDSNGYDDHSEQGLQDKQTRTQTNRRRGSGGAGLELGIDDGLVHELNPLSTKWKY
eukprot:5029705-Amphidinium_carterae.2